MYEVKAICDRCKTEIIVRKGKYSFQDMPKGWHKVELSLGQYNHEDYLLCEECCKNVGIYKPETENEVPKVATIEERLFECIAEIVQNVQG